MGSGQWIFLGTLPHSRVVEYTATLQRVGGSGQWDSFSAPLHYRGHGAVGHYKGWSRGWHALNKLLWQQGDGRRSNTMGQQVHEGLYWAVCCGS